MSLNRLRMPHGLLNIDGYFDPLLTMLERAVQEKMMSASVLEALQVETDAQKVLSKLALA